MTYRNLQILIAATMVCALCSARAEKTPFARYASYSLATIERMALFDVAEEDLLSGAIGGMVKQLEQQGDEHSQFIRAEDARRFQAEMRQQFGGIGIRIEFDREQVRPLVWGPPEPNAPAARAGIESGDLLLQVDGVDTAGKSLTWLLNVLRGPVSTEVRILLQRRTSASADPLGETFEVTLVREQIPIDSVLGDFRYRDGTWEFQIVADPNLALVRLTSFGDHTTRELKRTLRQLVDERVDGVVLDLRDNAGGALDSAVDVCDMLLPQGSLIVSIRGRGGDLRAEEVANGNGEFETLPLVVLVDRGTASAGEIVAAALQDHGRAAVVGERTYGKGTVQRVMRIGPGGESLLKLTTATFWRPSGKNIHRLPGESPAAAWGVQPNAGLVVEIDDEERIDYFRQRRERDMIPEASSIEPATGRDKRLGASMKDDLVLAKGVEVLSENLTRTKRSGE